LDGVIGSDPKTIGVKLNEIKEKARTNEEYFKIGTLYEFDLLVKTEVSMKDGFGFKDNRFFIEGAGNIKYTYNNGHVAKDPKLAAINFLKALERIPVLIENYKYFAEKAATDLPVLKEVVNSTWRKEDELKKLKSELSALERKIQLTITEGSPKETKHEFVPVQKNQEEKLKTVCEVRQRVI
jgi:hypothetical protein